MAVVAMNATKRGLSKGAVHGLGGTMKVLTATVEVGSSDTNAST